MAKNEKTAAAVEPEVTADQVKISLTNQYMRRDDLQQALQDTETQIILHRQKLAELEKDA